MIGGGRIRRESWRCVSKGCGSCCLERVDLRPFHKYRYKQITTIITEQLQLRGGQDNSKAARIIRNVFFIAHIYTCRSNALWDSPSWPSCPPSTQYEKNYEFLMKLTSCYVRVFICWRAHNYPPAHPAKQLDPRRPAANRRTCRLLAFSPSVLPLTPSAFISRLRFRSHIVIFGNKNVFDFIIFWLH